MNRISKNIIFNITIIERNEAEHTFLSKVIHRVVPQAIVQSIYNNSEAIAYFNNCALLPDLIFLDREMIKDSGQDALDLIKKTDGLDKVPLIFLTPHTTPHELTTDLTKQTTELFYSKPYEAQDLLRIVSTVNSKWLA